MQSFAKIKRSPLSPLAIFISVNTQQAQQLTDPGLVLFSKNKRSLKKWLIPGLGQKVHHEFLVLEGRNHLYQFARAVQQEILIPQTGWFK